jgi:hypothetical protein
MSCFPGYGAIFLAGAGGGECCGVDVDSGEFGALQSERGKRDGRFLVWVFNAGGAIVLSRTWDEVVFLRFPMVVGSCRNRYDSRAD